MEKSEPDIFVKHKQQEVHERAKQCWDTLRQSVLSVKKVLEEADVKDVTLTHGIYRDRKLNHHQVIHQVMYIPEHKEYLTCDGQSFHLFQEDGIKKDVVKCEIKLNRFVYCNQTDQYVVWNHEEEDLFLMTKEFMIISQSVAIGPVTIGLYNEKTGELITIGPHFITSWIFRYRAKYLTPRKTIRTTFGEENMFAAVVLEDTASKSQKMYCAVGTGLVVYNLFSGLEVCRRTELHTQPITALSFFNPLKYVITGARDGCIKVWDINWKVLMVFVGHSKEINFLKIYPHETCFISASLDCTMRVWSMETCDEIDKTIISEPISGIGTEMNSDVFYTFTGKRVDLWRIHHLYQMHTNIGYRVNRIKVTDHVAYPKRALLLCRDSSARIVCPCNGKVITTLLLQPSDGLVDAVYAIAEKTVFALLASGEIVKARTNCNPCQVVSRWKCNNMTEQCSNLLVYEYIVDPTGDSDVWSKAKDPTKNGRGQKNIHSNKNRTLLLGGRKDGYICVIDWMTGEITFKIEAHSGKSVLSIISNTKLDQIISAGMDNIIKVWRLFPFAEEALTPLMSFYCAHTPVHMTAIKTTLGVAFQDPSTATFSVVLYSLSDNSRNDHRPDDDHMDVITGFTSCARMKIYASCSMDGTIRIWSHTNSLVRILKVNSLPHSLSFCSSKGDLLVGINNHLFYIHHKQYLPKYYLRKQVCMKFLPIQNEDSIEFDENRLKALDKNDVKRLKNAHAAFTFPQYFDILSPEEEEAMLKEKQVREKAYGLLEIRDNELCQIRDGTLIAHNKPKASKKTRNKAFKEYMKIYYNKEKPKLPAEESIKEAVIRTLNQELKDYEGKEEEEEKYRAETSPVGFFPELAQKYQDQSSLSTDHACLPSVINGYLPNSVLLKILFPPPKPQEEEKDKKPYQPPKLTRKQLAEIQSLNPRKPLQVEEDEIAPDPPTRNVTFASDELLTHVLEIDNSDEEKKEEDKEGEMEEESAETKTPVVPSTQGSRTTTDLSGSQASAQGRLKHNLRQQLKKKKSISFSKDLDSSDDEDDQTIAAPKSSLMSKFQEIMDKPPPPKEKKESEKEIVVEEAIVAVKSSPLPTNSAKHQSPVPLKPVTKLVSRPRPTPVPVTPRSPTPAPTPPPPPTPLPGFIRQFVGTDWFNKYFPNCTEKTMPKPWTADHFTNMIVKLLTIAEWLHKISVTEAIVSVHSSEGLSDTVINTVTRSLLSVLNHHANPPSCSVAEQKDFILAALRAIVALASRDKDVIAELVVQFLDGDDVIRGAVVEVMINLGLQDPHKQFQKELDSWNIWNLDEKTRRNDLHEMASQWLDRWMSAYKLKIQDTVDKLKSGHSLQGRLSTFDTSRRTSTMPSDRSTVTTLPVGAQKRVSGRVSTTSFNSITVTLDNIQGSSIMESVTYIDAVTFFCEMMTDRELEALKRGDVSSRGTTEIVAQPKNTVLVLPKISHKPALVRLGQMHTSVCHADRETSLNSNYGFLPIRTKGRQQVPGEIRGFVSHINLPMKPLLLQPFTSNLGEGVDLFDKPLLITLKSSQKYFLPSTSYVAHKDEHIISVR